MRGRVFIALLVFSIFSQTWAQVDAPGFSIHGLTDVAYVYTDGAESWLSRGPGKLRFSEDDSNQIELADVGIAIEFAFDLQSKITVAGHHYGEGFELTEAFWDFRQLSNSAWRSRYRVGAFFPSFSMENIGPLWTSPYTVKPSAINTWIGEEIRIIGAEGKWTWIGDPHNKSKHQFSLIGGIYAYNDPMGAMISWRGWSVHDRQIGVTGDFPIRDLPLIDYTGHSTDYEPFMEIDDRPGFYVGAEWNVARSFKLQLVHYDNQGDDSQRQDDQYSWHTWFTQAAMHWQNDAGYEILGQFMTGNTLMARGKLDNDFKAAYLMVVKTWGQHRLAVRWDEFRVIDRDTIPFDYNDERGDSQTISYSYLFRQKWKVTIEATRLWSRQASRAHFGEDPRLAENQLLTSVRHYF